MDVCDSSPFNDISKLLEFGDWKEYFGIIEHKHSVYRISLQLPQYPLMKNAKIKIFKVDFTFDYEESDDVSDFFTKFAAAVNLCGEGTYGIEPKTEELTCNEITGSYCLSQKTYDISVASDLTAIQFSDASHYLTLSITKDLDVLIPSEHSLPDKHKWFQPTGTVTSYFNEFTKSLEELEEFYSNINAIDELCFVVDPMQPSTKNNSRIFKIDQKGFAKVVIDPLLPSSIAVTFIGPTLRVEHYRNKYEQEICNWDYDLDVHKNLLKICEEEDMPGCSICGMFRLGETIPMITCDNSKCDLLFHVGCLKQWWSMFADSKTFLFIEFKCPMCKEKLSASFDPLLSDREN